jgi:diphthine-ammonia ligase
MDRPRAAISWSGGKDGCTALQRVRSGFEVVAMITMLDEHGTRSRSHGLRPEVIAAQAERLGLHWLTGNCTWDTYTVEFCDVLRRLNEYGITHVIFGDIMFASHRAWNERVCATGKLTPVLPLWGEPTDRLLHEFLESGGDARLVTVRADCLDESWLGRRLTADLVPELQRRGVDPCGENGEYHTLVTNSPLFSSPLPIVAHGHVLKHGCWALDVSLPGGNSNMDDPHAAR